MERCPRCGLNRRSVRSEFCPACGQEFPALSPRPETPPLPVPLQRETSLPIPTTRGPQFHATSMPAPLNPAAGTFGQESESSGFFGSQTVQGVVIHLDGPYMVKPSFNWMKLVLFILLLPVIVSAGLAFAFIYAIWSLVFGSRSGRGGLLSNLSSQVLGFFLTGRLFGPKDQVPMLNVRLRLKSGEERHAQIRGEILIGNFNVGDDVMLQGFTRGGMLMVVGGRNLRTNSEIRIKRR